MRFRGRCCTFILALLGAVYAPAQEEPPWWYLLERGKLSFRQGDYGEALLSFEDARRRRHDRYAGMEQDLINFLSMPEVRALGDSLDILDAYARERNYPEVRRGLDELYYRFPPENLQNSALLALEELGKFKDYPEAEYWIGEVYRVEGELGLALGQYQRALGLSARLEDPDFELDLLYRVADLYRLRQDYRLMEESLLKIVEGSGVRGQPWDPLWAGSSGEFTRTSMARTLEISGPGRFLVMYRYNNGPVERAHRLLGLYYYASNRYNRAVEHLMFAFLIQNSILIEELRRDRYDFVFESLENLVDSLGRRADLLEYLDSSEYYRCAYYLGTSLYGIGRESSARSLWTFLSGRGTGEWRGRALAQLRRPSLEAPAGLPELSPPE
jgi:tetratricopeptide (TPR) repeat protein